MKRIADLYFHTSGQREAAIRNLRAMEGNPEWADLTAALRKAVNRPAWAVRLAEAYWWMKKELGLVK